MNRLIALVSLFWVCGLFQCCADADDFTWVQVGDLHCPAFSQAANGTNLVPWILAHTNDGVFNVRGVISCGDIFQRETNNFTPGSDFSAGWQIRDMTNDFYRLRNAGISVVLCNGNHDNDYFPGVGNPPSTNNYTSTFYWNQIFPIGFFSNQVGFIGSRFPNDSRNLIMAYTNGPIKLLFLTYCERDSNQSGQTHWNWYAPQTAWIKANAALYPDHNVIVLSHFYINGRTCLPDYVAGPGSVWDGPGRQPFDDGIHTVTNLLFMLAGHDRFLRKGSYSFQKIDGGVAQVIQFNTQGFNGLAVGTNWTGNPAYLNLLTFRPKSGLVEVSTYDFIKSQYLTNGDPVFANGLGVAPVNRWKVPLARPVTRKIFSIR